MIARRRRRPGAGRPPLAGTARRERLEIKLSEAERAEIEAAVPDGEAVSRWVADAALDRARNQQEIPGPRRLLATIVAASEHDQTPEEAEQELVADGVNVTEFTDRVHQDMTDRYPRRTP